MASQTGQTDIVRMAAVHIGSSEHIGSIDDAIDVCRRFKAVWELAVEDVIAAHPWNPVVRVRALDRDPVAPIGSRYPYRYKLASLPDGCVCWWPWDKDSSDWFCAEEEDGFILTHEAGPIIVRYNWRNDNVETWSPGMKVAMAARLAHVAALGQTQMMGVADRMAELWVAALREAKRRDGLSTGNVSRGTVSGKSRWAMARRLGARPR